MPSDIKKDYAWNTLGVLLQNAISPILLVIIARLNGVYDVGLFSFAFAVSLLFYAIAMWGGRTYQVSDAKKEFATSSYVNARLLLGVVAIAGSGLFCLVNGYDSFKTMLISGLVIFKVWESVADALYGVMQTKGRLYSSGISLSLKSLGGIGAFLAVDALTHNLVLGVLAIVIVNAIVVFLYDIPLVHSLEPSALRLSFTAGTKSSGAILKRTLPVFIITFLSMFSLYIPRYFIDIFHPDQNGYFGIIAMPITLVLLVMTFILQPNVVQLAALYRENEYKKFNGLVTKIGIIIISVGVAIVGFTYIAGPLLFHVVFGIDFVQHRDDLTFIVVGGVINAFVAVGINVLTIMRQFIGQFVTLLATTILLGVFAYVCVPSGGMSAGVWLFCGTAALQAAVLIGLYKHILRKRVNNAKKS